MPASIRAQRDCSKSIGSSHAGQNFAGRTSVVPLSPVSAVWIVCSPGGRVNALGLRPTEVRRRGKCYPFSPPLSPIPA